MKKQLIQLAFIYICLLISFNLFSQDSNFTLRCKIDSQFNGMPIMLFTFKADSIHNIDTTMIKNGSFVFHGNEYLEDEALLTTGNFPENVISTYVFLERGNIFIDLTDSVSQLARGTHLNDLMVEYDSIMRRIEKKYQLTKSAFNNGLISQDSLNILTYSLRHEKDSIAANFKRANLSNLFGKIIFKKGLNNLSDPYFDEIYALADEELKSDPDVIAYIERREKSGIEMIQSEKIIGKQYLDFELNILNGDPRKLSDYVGTSKFLFVDFWASWCGPCIADIPNIKKAYEKFHEKGLEVLGISLDNQEVSWKKALNWLDAPWTQLIVKKNSESLVREMYHFTGIPYSILIDKRGYIIYVDLRGHTLEQILEKLLNN